MTEVSRLLEWVRENAAVVALLAALLSAGAAVISSAMAFKSWTYTRRMTRANVSLLEVKVEGKRVSSRKVDFQLLFILKNIGQVSLEVIELETAYFEFGSKQFVLLTEGHSIVNRIHSEAVFNHPVKFSLDNIDPNLSNEQVATTMPQWVGRVAFILALTFRGEGEKQQSVRYYIGYKGLGVYQIARTEYEEMEPYLPEALKLSR